MLLKDLLTFIICIILLSTITTAAVYEVEDVKNSLRKALFDFLTDPSDAQLTANEIKDMLNFYLNIPLAEVAVDCSAVGSESGKEIAKIIDDANAKITAKLPTCNDGTTYSECSTQKPKYCYSGKLIDKCEICSCPSGQICENNKCVLTDVKITCHVDSDCGTSHYVGDNFCMNNNVYKNYIMYNCINKGTANSYCIENETFILIETCEYDCSSGACVNITECINKCTNAEDKRCYNNTYTQTCGDYDHDPCFEWSPSILCPNGCQDGVCIEEPICVNKCGNGICEEIVCEGSGCPCAENDENCPQDCGVRCTDSDGGYILAGRTYRNDFLLIKTDSNGSQEWHKTFGDDKCYDVAQSGQQTSDGGYILAGRTHLYVRGQEAGYDEGLLLIKTDSNGGEEWHKTFGVRNSGASSVQQTSDGGYILAGHTYPFGAWMYAWLLKTDSNGNKEWETFYGGLRTSWAPSVQQTSDGGYILIVGEEESGAFFIRLIKTDSNGNKEWEKEFDGFAHSVQQTYDGGYILTGGKSLTKTSLIKTDSNGNMEWEKEFYFASRIRSVQQTYDGSYILTSGKFLIKTDSNGNMEWEKEFYFASRIRSVQQTYDGGYIVTGYKSTSTTTYNVWLLKTDSNGNKEWEKTFVQGEAYSLQKVECK